MLGGSGVRRGRHRVQRGILDVGGHQLADAAVQGGGEEHPLTACGRLVEDAGDRRHEAEVGHVVRLVEHRDEDVGERAGMPLEQVDAPAGRRHDDVGVANGADLPADRHAAVDRGDAHADAAAQRRERVGDLLGEFARGDEDQAAGRLFAAPVRALAAMRVSIGRPKASVLPDPVWARPSTSRPASASAAPGPAS